MALIEYGIRKNLVYMSEPITYKTSVLSLYTYRRKYDNTVREIRVRYKDEWLYQYQFVKAENCFCKVRHLTVFNYNLKTFTLWPF